jgi:hypothetical protein
MTDDASPGVTRANVPSFREIKPAFDWMDEAKDEDRAAGGVTRHFAMKQPKPVFSLV